MSRSSRLCAGSTATRTSRSSSKSSSAVNARTGRASRPRRFCARSRSSIAHAWHPAQLKPSERSIQRASSRGATRSRARTTRARRSGWPSKAPSSSAATPRSWSPAACRRTGASSSTTISSLRQARPRPFLRWTASTSSSSGEAARGRPLTRCRTASSSWEAEPWESSSPSSTRAWARRSRSSRAATTSSRGSSVRRVSSSGTSCARRAWTSGSAPRQRARRAAGRGSGSSSRTGTPLEADQLLVATGRRPNVEGFGLDKLDVRIERHGNRGGRSSVRRRPGLGRG